jgi:hypothetical protein
VSDPVGRRRAHASTRRLIRVTVITTVMLMAVAIPLGWMAGGRSGAASAVVGVALTAVLFTGGLLGLHRASGRAGSGTGGLGAILAAFALRIVVYASAFALVSRAAWVDGPSLALATAASLAVMLGVELRAVAKEPVPELETGIVGGSDVDSQGSADETSTTRRS